MNTRIAVAVACVATGVVTARVRPVGHDLTEPPTPLFRQVAQEIGLRFTHEAGAEGQYRLPEIIGSGVALLDYDGDGDLDVYLVQGSPDARTSNRLFRNGLMEDRRLHFRDVTEHAGVGRR